MLNQSRRSFSFHNPVIVITMLIKSLTYLSPTKMPGNTSSEVFRTFADISFNSYSWGRDITEGKKGNNCITVRRKRILERSCSLQCSFWSGKEGVTAWIQKRSLKLEPMPRMQNQLLDLAMTNSAEIFLHELFFRTYT